MSGIQDLSGVLPPSPSDKANLFSSSSASSASSAFSASTETLNASPSVVSSVSSPSASRRSSIVTSNDVESIYSDAYIASVIKATIENKRKDKMDMENAMMQPFYEMLEALRKNPEASRRFVEGSKRGGIIFNMFPPEFQAVLDTLDTTEEGKEKLDRRDKQRGGGFNENLTFLFWLLLVYFLGLSSEHSGIGRIFEEFTTRSLPSILIGGLTDIVVETGSTVYNRSNDFRKFTEVLFFLNDTQTVPAGLGDWIADVEAKAPGLAFWTDETFVPEPLALEYSETNRLVSLYETLKANNRQLINIEIAKIIFRNPEVVTRVSTNSSYSLRQIQGQLREYEDVVSYLDNVVEQILNIKEGESYKGTEKDAVKLFEWMTYKYDENIARIDEFRSLFGIKHHDFTKFEERYNIYRQMKPQIPLLLDSRDIFEHIHLIIKREENETVTERDQLCFLALALQDPATAANLCGLTVQTAANTTALATSSSSASSSEPPLVLFVGEMSTIPTSFQIGYEGTMTTSSATPTPYTTGVGSVSSTPAPTRPIVPSPTTAVVAQAEVVAPAPFYVVSKYVVGVPDAKFTATEEETKADLAPIESNTEIIRMDKVLADNLVGLTGPIVQNLAKSLVTNNYINRTRLYLSHINHQITNERLLNVKACLDDAKRALEPYVGPEDDPSLFTSTLQVVKLLLKEGIILRESKVLNLYDKIKANSSPIHPEDAQTMIRTMAQDQSIRFDKMVSNYTRGVSGGDQWFSFLFNDPYRMYPWTWNRGSRTIFFGAGFLTILFAVYIPELLKACVTCGASRSCTLCKRQTQTAIEIANQTPPAQTLRPIKDTTDALVPSSSSSSSSTELVPATQQERALAVLQAILRAGPSPVYASNSSSSSSIVPSTGRPSRFGAPLPTNTTYYGEGAIVKPISRARGGSPSASSKFIAWTEPATMLITLSENRSDTLLKGKLSVTADDIIREAFAQTDEPTRARIITLLRVVKPTLANQLRPQVPLLTNPSSASTTLVTSGYYQRKRTYKRKNPRTLTRKRRLA